MHATFGQNHNIHEKKSKRSMLYYYTPAPPIKRAHHLLTQENVAEATEWQLLYQSIRNTLLRSNVEHLSPISEVTKVVINWGEQRQGTSRASFAVVKEYINMKMLADWQKEFFSLLQKESDIKKAIFFRLRDCENVWVEICHPTTENILRYSELYMQFLHSKIDENLFFEFIVFGVGEANEQSLPRDAISFDLK